MSSSQPPTPRASRLWQLLGEDDAMCVLCKEPLCSFEKGRLRPVGVIARACRQRLPRPGNVRSRQMAVTASLHPSALGVNAAPYTRSEPFVAAADSSDRLDAPCERPITQPPTSQLRPPSSHVSLSPISHLSPVTPIFRISTLTSLVLSATSMLLPFSIFPLPLPPVHIREHATLRLTG